VLLTGAGALSVIIGLTDIVSDNRSVQRLSTKLLREQAGVAI